MLCRSPLLWRQNFSRVHSLCDMKREAHLMHKPSASIVCLQLTMHPQTSRIDERSERAPPSHQRPINQLSPLKLPSPLKSPWLLKTPCASASIPDFPSGWSAAPPTQGRLFDLGPEPLPLWGSQGPPQLPPPFISGIISICKY